MSASVSSPLSNIGTADSADILLVDDDAIIREVTAFALRTLGHFPVVSPSPAAALEAAAALPGLRLLIADVVMPGMNGVEFADQVRAIHPNIQVMFCSGYSQVTLASRGLRVGGQQFLQKPISLPVFSAKIRELLGPATEKGAT